MAEKGFDFEKISPLEAIFYELKESVLAELEQRYGPGSLELRDYHNLFHTAEYMLPQVERLADGLGASQQEKWRALMATLFHDLIFDVVKDTEVITLIDQRLEVAIQSATGLPNEEKSADEMERVLSEKGVAKSDIEAIRSIILVTDASYASIPSKEGGGYATFVQDALATDSPLEHFLVALPDVNLCGSKDFALFKDQGNRIFHERYVGVGDAKSKTISLSRYVQEIPFWAELMRRWTAGQVEFAQGRKLDFHRKVKTIEDGGRFTKDQHEFLMEEYGNFDDNIEQAKVFAEKARNMSEEELFRSFDYAVVE